MHRRVLLHFAVMEKKILNCSKIFRDLGICPGTKELVKTVFSESGYSYSPLFQETQFLDKDAMQRALLCTMYNT